MGYAGGIIGLPFSLEGYAFFIEAIFLGIYLYGWDRLSPRAHWLAGIPVAVASRTGSGAVEGLYAGGGADLARAGALFAGDLSPWQARLLLAVALATAPDDPAGAARAWMARTGVTPDAPGGRATP